VGHLTWTSTSASPRAIPLVVCYMSLGVWGLLDCKKGSNVILDCQIDEKMGVFFEIFSNSSTSQIVMRSPC